MHRKVLSLKSKFTLTLIILSVSFCINLSLSLFILYSLTLCLSLAWLTFACSLNGISAADLFSIFFPTGFDRCNHRQPSTTAVSPVKGHRSSMKRKDKRKLKLNFMRSYEYIQSHVMLQVSSDIFHFHVFRIFV